MKKTLFIEIILLFILATLLYFTISYWKSIAALLYDIDHYNFNDEIIISFHNSIKAMLPYSILSLLSALADIAAMILIAIKDFPFFRPLVEKLQAKSQARKQSKKQAKEERAKALKQAKIEQLESELDKLKNE